MKSSSQNKTFGSSYTPSHVCLIIEHSRKKRETKQQKNNNMNLHTVSESNKFLKTICACVKPVKSINNNVVWNAHRMWRSRLHDVAHWRWNVWMQKRYKHTAIANVSSCLANIYVTETLQKQTQQWRSACLIVGGRRSVHSLNINQNRVVVWHSRNSTSSHVVLLVLYRFNLLCIIFN